MEHFKIVLYFQFYIASLISIGLVFFSPLASFSLNIHLYKIFGIQFEILLMYIQLGDMEMMNNIGVAK